MFTLARSKFAFLVLSLVLVAGVLPGGADDKKPCACSECKCCQGCKGDKACDCKECSCCANCSGKKAKASKDIPGYLDQASVMIKAGPYSGSGVVSVTKDGTAWTWTAAHVIEALRHSRQSDDKKTVVEFDDAIVQRIIVENGRSVGKVEAYAEIMRYSDADHGHDLALLRIRMKNFPASGAKWYLGKDIPKVDVDLYHCGSMLGEIGANSVTRGNLSAVGRLIDGKEYDQSDCRTLPGSSGGGIFLRDTGECIGLLTRGAAGVFSLHVPSRRVLSYAKETGVDFTLDPSVAAPSEKDLKAKSIDSGK